MCLIIVPDKDKPLVISESQLRDIYTRNDDGFGFMWTRDGNVRAVRGVGKVDDMIAMYNRVKHIPGVVFHARQATHGTVTLENAHPFKVTPFIALVHNGIIGDVEITEQGFSDTWHFAYRVLPDVVERTHKAAGLKLTDPEAWDFMFDDDKWKASLEQWLGSNKVVMLHSDGRRVVFNEKGGHTKDGQWYSNTYAASFLNTCVSTYTGSYGGMGYGKHYGNYDGDDFTPSNSIGRYGNRHSYRWDAQRNGFYNGVGDKLDSEKKDRTVTVDSGRWSRAAKIVREWKYRDGGKHAPPFNDDVANPVIAETVKPAGKWRKYKDGKTRHWSHILQQWVEWWECNKARNDLEDELCIMDMAEANRAKQNSEVRKPKMKHDATGGYAGGTCSVCQSTAWNRCDKCGELACYMCTHRDKCFNCLAEESKAEESKTEADGFDGKDVITKPAVESA